jgi:hypothetical protein
MKIAIAALALMLAAPVAATVITFDEPGSGPVYTSYNPTYRQGGLTFTTPYGEAVWLPIAGQGANNGTNNFINGFSALTISRTRGGDFRFEGLDYGQGLYSSNATDPLVVTLNLAGGGTLIINRTSTGSFQTLHAGSFLVSSVVLGATSGYLSIDNLTVGMVPEPGSWALMLGGFAVIGLTVRKRRAIAAA